MLQTEKSVKNKFEKIAENAASYGVTKKTVYALFSIIACVFLIFVISLVQADFNTAVLKQWPFWVNVILGSGISIYGLITGQKIGDDISRNNKKGAFRSSLTKYANVFQKLQDSLLFAYFEDWLSFYRDRKRKKKIEDILKNNGIYQLEVLDLDLTELDKLLQPYKKEWAGTLHAGKYKDDITYFMSYTEEQINIIRLCLTGAVKVAELPKSFFCSALDRTNKDMWESASKSEKKKGLYLGLNYTYKILILLVISFILSGLVPNKGGEEGATAGKAFISVASRLFNLTSSVVWGIYLGFELVKIDREYLDFKTMILTQYQNDVSCNIFIPKTLNEKAKEAYENAIKKLEQGVVDDGENES